MTTIASPLISRGTPPAAAAHPDVRQAAPIGLQVPAVGALVRIAPEAARHPRPRLADHELADGATHRTPMLVHDVGIDARTRPDERPGLDRRPGRAADDPARDLGAPGVIDDRAA